MNKAQKTDFRAFSENYAKGQSQIIWLSLAADTLTPVGLMTLITKRNPWSFLLESVEGGRYRGRYCAIGTDPDMIWHCRGNKAHINHHPRPSYSGSCSGAHSGAYSGAGADSGDHSKGHSANHSGDRFKDDFTPCPRPALLSLRHWIKESKITIPKELPPMAAGLFGYLSYDSVRLMETLPKSAKPGLDLPDGIFMRPQIMAIFDHVDDTLFITTPVRPQNGISATRAWEMAHQRCDGMLEVIKSAHAEPTPIPLIQSLAQSFNRPFDRPSDRPEWPDTPGPDVTGKADASDAIFADVTSNTDYERYCAMVEQARRYIHAGDIFQVVLSQRFTRPFTSSPLALYRSLRRLNPSPFLFCFNFDTFSIVGSSPEILVRVENDKVSVRPIAGTRRRGQTPAQDERQKADLLADPKELAEHLMLLDLGRNDVSRVSEPASVRVSDKMKVELYSHVMHIVSHVEGTMKKDYSALDALIAGFPAGTVSGAPKIRAMEIIDELEGDHRGIYAGGVGYFSADQQMDMCIALRTAILTDKTLHVQAGAGIVADSIPDSEYHECRHKARALLHAAATAALYE